MTDTTVKHPAKFSKELIPIFAEIIPKGSLVFDPFAGVGGIHKLQEYGIRTIGLEIEPEWASQHINTALGDVLSLPDDWVGIFDAIVTSPTYGNRMADHHDARDGSVRHTYKHDLGRDLTKGNSGAMQWGPEYREFHTKAWFNCIETLKPGGLFVLNIKDHIRKGRRQYVAGWHVTTLVALGLELQYHVPVDTPGMRFGENHQARYQEEIYVFRFPTEHLDPWRVQ